MRLLPICLAAAAAFCTIVVSLAWASAAYRDYATALIASPPANIQFRPDLERQLNGLASAERAAAGRGALAPSELVLTAAHAQALDMLNGNYVGHHSPSGYRFRQRFEAFAGYERGSFAENAARARGDAPADTAKARGLFQQWLDSTGHRRNLMRRDYRFVSTGVVQRGTHIYAVQIYWER